MPNSILMEENNYVHKSLTLGENNTDSLPTQQNSTLIDYLILFILGAFYVSSILYYVICFMLNL
jgi:hypothetical protein